MRVFLLLHPFLARFVNLHVEIPKHTRQDGAHFTVRETKPGGVRKATDATHIRWRAR